MSPSLEADHQGPRVGLQNTVDPKRSKSPLLEQSASVLKALEGTAARQDAALMLWHRMLTPGVALFPVDMVASGAVKRCMSQCGALELLIGAWNMICARALLRMQIDTALRFSAVWLVQKPSWLAREVLKGKRIDMMRDRDGRRMTDRYLVSKLTPAHPWLPAVYETTSGYIHFSGEHLISPISRMGDDEPGSMEYLMSETDTKYPESSWLEVVQCFNEATDIFLHYLRGWIQTKEADAAESK